LAPRPRELTLAATAYAALGRRDEARRAFTAALAADPRGVTGYENLGAFELAGGDPRAAVGYFAEALTLDASSPAGRLGLTEALARVR
jgi:Flp pilus assembly protein TadD